MRLLVLWKKPQKESLIPFTGHYSSSEAAESMEFDIKEGQLFALLTPSTIEKLTPSFPDAFYAGRNKLFEFVRNEKGEINGLNIRVTRAENIYFERVE